MPDRTLKTISATQCAALFDVSPYTTRWLLWRVFTEREPMEVLDEEENERLLWGRIHEPAIFNEMVRRLNLEGRYNAEQDYVRHPELPVGCTPDGFVWHPSKGKAIVQVKCVDWLVWKDSWTDDTPPPHIVAQVQHEMLVCEATWAVIPCLINGNELRLYELTPDEDFQAQIVERTKAFFDMVAKDEEPDPLGIEIEVPQLLKREYKPKSVIDLTDNEQAFDAIQALRVFEPQASLANKMVKEAKAKLLALSDGHQIIKAHGYGCEIALSATKESAVELPAAVQLMLATAGQELLEAGQNELAEKAIEAANWRQVTRSAGVTRRYKTWEEHTDEAPSWLEPFDINILGA